MDHKTRLRIKRSHRMLGMLATIPIVAWIFSSFVLHGVALVLPNGLQGVYELEQYHESDVALEDDTLAGPPALLRALRQEGLDRIYWLRLEPLGGQPAYIVKPGPFDLERVYDARTLDRLDPLPDDLLRNVVHGHLVNSNASEIHDADEFNRYYAVDRVPAVEVEMDGAQPSRLVFSKASGRILRRTDPLAAWFEVAYRNVHVWQWGDSLQFFTALLYALAGVSLIVVALGYVMWWTRRDARKRWTPAVRRSRRVHARLAPIAGLLLATQMLVGAYLWFNLGLIEPQFRGQGSFRSEWSGGITTSEELASAATIAAAVPAGATESDRSIQRYEWRAIGDQRFWLAYPERDANGVLMDAGTGEVLGRLSPELAAQAGREVVNGEPDGGAIESDEYWMDFNARVPTYRFRFADPDDSDIHISQITGEVVQRRPAIWRAFGPFLAYHTFGFTGNPWLDTILLTTLQLAVLTMVATGWAMALRRRKAHRLGNISQRPDGPESS